MLALMILGSVLGYFMVGRTVAAATWRTWHARDPASLAARFFFPITTRFDAERFGEYKDDGDPPWIGNCNSESSDRHLYHWCIAGLWPFRLTWSLVNAMITLTGALTGLPMRLLAEKKPAKALPEPRAVDGETATLERRYLDADQRERELHAQLEAAQLEKNDAARALGGEDEAKKLLALPERKF